MANTRTFQNVKIKVTLKTTSTRANLANTEDIAVSLGKIQKWYTDLNTIAWNGHPTYTSKTSGLYKITVDGTGHVSATANMAAADVSTLLNLLTTGTSIPQDSDYYISQYVGGGTTTTTYHRRPMSALWTYIKGKADSVYLANTTKYALSGSVGGDALYSARLRNIAVNDTTLHNTSGSFSFSGANGQWSGTDWVGLQIGNDLDKFQLHAHANRLQFRQNDYGGTDSTHWSDWVTCIAASDVNGGTGINVVVNGTSPETQYVTVNHSTISTTTSTSTASLAHGGTFTAIDSITTSNGHITKINTKTVTLPTDNNTDTKVSQSAATANYFRPLIIGNKNSSTEGDASIQDSVTDVVYTNAKFYVNPNTGILASTTFKSNATTGNFYTNRTGVTRGTAPSATVWTQVVQVRDNANNVFGAVEHGFTTAKLNRMNLIVYRGTDATDNTNAQISVGFDGNGDWFTYAPTPASGDNSTKIATTAFIKTALSSYSTTSHTHSNYLGAVNKNGYYGMGQPDGTDTAWIRTTNKGIIPYEEGGLGSGHQSLGTSTWYFNNSYIDNMYTGFVAIVGTLPQLKFQQTTSEKAYNNGNAGIKCYPVNTNGMDMTIQSGGRMIIGGGEYPTNFYNATKFASDEWGTEESMYLGADNSILFHTNANTIANRKLFIFGSSGYMHLPISGGIYFRSGSDDAAVRHGLVSAGASTAKTWTLPNKTGTIALTSDIPTVKNATSVSHTDYNNNNDYVPNLRFLSYWNGAYNANGSSNLAYCKQGQFGTIITKNAGDYIPMTGSESVTGNLMVTKSSGDTYFRTKRSDTDVSVYFGIGSGGANHGIYSHKMGGWMVYSNGTHTYLNTTSSGNVYIAGHPLVIGSTHKDSWGGIPVINGSDGVMEVGKYLDFHNADGSDVDYDWRLYTNSTTQMLIRCNVNSAGSNISPTTNNTYDLGTTSLKWRNIYATTFNGNATTATKWAATHKLNGIGVDGSADKRIPLDSGLVRMDASTVTATANCWYKVASASTSTTYCDIGGVFEVIDHYGNVHGILKVRARTEGTAGTFGNTRNLIWLVAHESLDINNYAIVCYNNKTETGGSLNGTATVELWTKATGRYESLSFVLLDESTRTSRAVGTWTFYNYETANDAGQTSLPTGGNISYSILATIANNAKTASSATTAAFATKATQDGSGNIITSTYLKGQDTGWVQFTITNSYFNTTDTKIYYRRYGAVVTVCGQFRLTNEGNKAFIGSFATLPTGCRPKYDVIEILPYNTMSMETSGAIRVSTNGALSLAAYNNGTWQNGTLKTGGVYDVSVTFVTA